ncbi:Chaperone surA [Gossypium australe]|uniref:Chaperone surA n=1 Tax=Gossypium australe TaxID=47621 RepID=A0A5B6WUL4_9ROSI|nr:Chaperone surA [Gossypium australe]
MDLDRAIADEVESNASAPAQGATPSESRPPTVSQGGGEGARKAFLHMMNQCYSEFVQTNLNVQHPLPPPFPKPIPVAPQSVELANVDDDPERVEFWLENTIRGHIISLVKDTSICGTERKGYMGILSRGILKEIH